MRGETDVALRLIHLREKGNNAYEVTGARYREITNIGFVFYAP